jgi:hypothetical protein
VSGYTPDTSGLKYVTLQRYTMEQKPRRWFRELHNSIFTYHQNPLNQPCMLEPGPEPYVVYYGILEINYDRNPLSFNHAGWASPYGDCGNCPTHGPGGTLPIPGEWTGWEILGYEEEPVNPAYSYPVTFYRNGSYVGACPTPQGYPFVYYNRNNPPWDGS